MVPFIVKSLRRVSDKAPGGRLFYMLIQDKNVFPKVAWKRRRRKDGIQLENRKVMEEINTKQSKMLMNYDGANN